MPRRPRRRAVRTPPLTARRRHRRRTRGRTRRLCVHGRWSAAEVVVGGGEKNIIKNEKQ